MIGVGHAVPCKLLGHLPAEVIACSQLPAVPAAPEVHLTALGDHAGVILPAHYARLGHAVQPCDWREAPGVLAITIAQLPKPIVACTQFRSSGTASMSSGHITGEACPGNVNKKSCFHAQSWPQQLCWTNLYISRMRCRLFPE